VHGAFDFVLIMQAVFLPGRVSATAQELLPITCAIIMTAGAIGWVWWRWTHGVRQLVEAYEAPLGIVATTRGGYVPVAVQSSSAEEVPILARDSCTPEEDGGVVELVAV
jgi:hypothetical protein